MKHLRAPTRHGAAGARALLAATTIALLLSWNSPTRVQASAGDLDLSFGTGGKVTTPFLNVETAGALAIQPDGKLIAAGSSVKRDDEGVIALARYNSDGSLDASFGEGGKAMADCCDSFDNAYAVEVLPDGRIVAAGQCANKLSSTHIDFVLACFTPDGNLDTAFGTAGKVFTDFRGNDDGIRGLAIQSDGRIVAAGFAYVPNDEDIALARYNPDGTLDTTFGDGGKLLTDIGANDNGASAVAIQRDGRIIVAGYAHSYSGGVFALVRYNSDGSLDTTFGDGGKVTDDPFSGAGARDMAFTPDGRIVLAGLGRWQDMRGGCAIARYTSDGSLDTSFGSGGGIVADIGAIPEALVVQPDGRIVVTGTIDRWPSKADFVLARFDSDGSPDSTFGSGGTVSTDFFDTDDRAYALALLPNGRLVVAGFCGFGGVGNWDLDFAMACYRTDLETAPRIDRAEVIGKKLLVHGANFAQGAQIFLNGEKQKTASDEAAPTTILIGRKAGKRIAPGQRVMLQVRNPDERLSNQFMFTRPVD